MPLLLVKGLQENDAQQCVGTALSIERPAANQESCHSPLAIRHSKEKPLSVKPRRAPQIRLLAYGLFVDDQTFNLHISTIGQTIRVYTGSEVAHVVVHVV
jgi:hypothetical protein